jgi:4-hydroxy-2-oxoheptanedioate aldolase
MKENAVKTRVKGGTPVYGVLTPVYDSAIAEVIGRLGFDFYIVDCEHGAAGPVQVEHTVRACETVGLTPMARVRSTDPKLILQFLDVGMMGVMMPGIREVDDVKRLVDAVRYPPLGLRGIAPVRANDYLLGPMAQDEYVRFANEQIMVLPQIETKEALACLHRLVQVEGVDGFIVGPRDLSMSLGFYDGPSHEEVRAVIRGVFETVRGAGLPVGITASTGEEARMWVEQGARLILGSVNGLLKLGASTFFKGAG